MKGYILRMLNICLHETNLSLNQISVQFYLFIYLFIYLSIYLFVYSAVFLQYDNTQKVKPKKKKKLKHKYNTYNTILPLRNLQKTGVSFHQVPLASHT